MSTSSSQSHAHTVITFDVFTLDPGRREILVGGQKLDASDRTFEFLWQLAQQPSEVVLKQDLLDALWPEQYVTEASLSRLVSDTRQLLAPHTSDSDLIQTVRGRGFRLRAAVADASIAAAPVATAVGRWPFLNLGGLGVAGVGLAVALLVVAAIQFWPRESAPTEPETQSFDSNSFSAADGSLLVLPVQVRTGDDQDTWAQYGVMAMLTQQLQTYERLPVISAHSAISGLAQIGFDAADPDQDVRDLDDADFQQICGALGCKQLLATRLELENEQLVLQYRLHGPGQRSAVYRFVSTSAIDAAEMLSEHVVARLIPDSRERLDLKPFYTDDAVANRNLALGASSLYHADYAEAKIYLQLALKRQPDFIWAKLYMADATLRLGEFDLATEFLDAASDIAMNTQQSLAVSRLRGNLLYAQGKLLESQQVSLQAAPVAELAGDHEGHGMALMNAGTTFIALGEPEPARQYLQQAVDVFSAHGFALREAQAQFNLGNAMQIADADPGEVADVYQRSAAAFLNYNANTYLAYALHGLAGMNRLRGRFEQARDQFARAEELYRNNDDVQGAQYVIIDLATLELDSGNLSAAQKHAEAVLQYAADPASYLHSYSAAVLVQIYLRQDQIEPIPALLSAIEAAEWFDPRAPFSLLPASYAHRTGGLDQAVELAKAVQERLGDGWTESHQAYMDLFIASVEQGEVLPMDYFNGVALP